MYSRNRTVLLRITALLLCALSLSALLAGCGISSNDAAGIEIREYMRQGMSQDQAENEYLIRDLMRKDGLTRDQAKAKLIEEAKRIQEENLSEDIEVQKSAAAQPGVYNLDPKADPDAVEKQEPGPEKDDVDTKLQEWLDYLRGWWLYSQTTPGVDGDVTVYGHVDYNKAVDSIINRNKLSSLSVDSKTGDLFYTDSETGEVHTVYHKIDDDHMTVTDCTDNTVQECERSDPPED